MNTTVPRAISEPLHAAIVGTGYIAEFHARAIRAMPRVKLVSVCDANLRSAQSFAAAQGVPAAFDFLESMLEAQRLDVIHILAPPDKHHLLAKTALQSGVNVFLEKPMCTSVDEAEDLLALAREKGLRVGVNHNFLFSGAYRRLRDVIHSGAIGPLDHVSFNHFFELSQIRSGPYDAWTPPPATPPPSTSPAAKPRSTSPKTAPSAWSASPSALTPPCPTPRRTSAPCSLPPSPTTSPTPKSAPNSCAPCLKSKRPPAPAWSPR